MEPTTEEKKVETTEDLKQTTVKSEDEASEARTLTPREQKQADERAALQAELFAEPSNADETGEKQATTEDVQPKADEGATKEEAPSEKVEEEGEEAKETKAGEVPEATEVNFAKLFPGGLEVSLEDGKKIVIQSDQELIDRLAVSERKEVQDRLNWEKSLHQKGQKFNQEQIEYLAERKAREVQDQARDRELAELRQFKAEAERVKRIPARPPKPDESLNDPEADAYNPAEYRQRRKAWDDWVAAATDPRLVDSLVADRIERALKPPEVDRIEQSKTEAFNAYEDWVKKQTDLTPELAEQLQVKAQPKFDTLIAELNAHNAAHPDDLQVVRPRDVVVIYGEAKAEVLGEVKAKRKTPEQLASESGARSVLRALTRAEKGQRPSKQGDAVQSEVNSLDEALDDSVSVEDFRKLARSGKLYRPS